MENININSKPLIGTKANWGKIFVAYLLLGVAALLVKGCDNDNDHPLFIFKEAISWK